MSETDRLEKIVEYYQNLVAEDLPNKDRYALRLQKRQCLQNLAGVLLNETIQKGEPLYMDIGEIVRNGQQTKNYSMHELMSHPSIKEGYIGNVADLRNDYLLIMQLKPIENIKPIENA